MTYFLLIMVVFLMAYGVAQQAILFPHEPGSWSLIPKVFFRPYFQVYGELFIEDTSYSGKLFLLFFPSPGGYFLMCAIKRLCSAAKSIVFSHFVQE